MNKYKQSKSLIEEIKKHGNLSPGLKKYVNDSIKMIDSQKNGIYIPNEQVKELLEAVEWLRDGCNEWCTYSQIGQKERIKLADKRYNKLKQALGGNNE